MAGVTGYFFFAIYFADAFNVVVRLEAIIVHDTP
jgi:hypothetical protein